jgi:hypothetical protein
VRTFRAALSGIAIAAALAGCATVDDGGQPPAGPALTATEARALVMRLLPDGVADRAGWATDIYAAFAVLEVPPTIENLCAAIAITGQESSFRADPSVPNLAAIARKEIEARRERAGVPRLVLDAALALPSGDGRSYKERLDAVRTERELSLVFEDFVARVPLGSRFLADYNPVRTGGPMQVAIAFAEAHAAAKPYPYPVRDTIRHEVFTRRGGLYFGIAHLLDYSAPYDRPLYRFADYNAGRYASRNAAFQSAVQELTGIPLALDGDLLRYANGRPVTEPGNTELAVRTLAVRLGLGHDAIRRDLERGRSAGFERTTLWARVFAQADRIAGQRVPRAVLPRIALKGPKIMRPLTTDWFARRVDTRHRTCVARSGAENAPAG